MESLMQEAISNLTEQLNKKKNDLIINRVYDLADVQEPPDFTSNKITIELKYK